LHLGVSKQSEQSFGTFSVETLTDGSWYAIQNCVGRIGCHKQKRPVADADKALSFLSRESCPIRKRVVINHYHPEGNESLASIAGLTGKRSRTLDRKVSKRISLNLHLRRRDRRGRLKPVVQLFNLS
jgi:hypothetical protein